MNKENIYRQLRYAAIFGNALYIFWLLYNGMDEGFKGLGIVQAAAIIGMLFLLIINIVLLSRKG